MELGMTSGEVALQEAWEEAGLTGVLRRQPIGTYTYDKFRKRYRVRVFVMEVMRVADDYPERDERRRRWLTPNQAMLHLSEPGLRRLMQKVVDAALAAAPT
jgi:8-oxo-dGTP pyrophosphatase MutT (NUDIX family)